VPGGCASLEADEGASPKFWTSSYFYYRPDGKTFEMKKYDLNFGYQYKKKRPMYMRPYDTYVFYHVTLATYTDIYHGHCILWWL
jgi:hypothetical protein